MRHAGQKLQQRARPFGKLKTIQQLVADAGGMTAHHVTDMQFGHFIVAHVHHRIALVAQSGDDALLFVIALGELNTRKDMGVPGVGVAVIEFGNGCLLYTSCFFRRFRLPRPPAIAVGVGLSVSEIR